MLPVLRERSGSLLNLSEARILVVDDNPDNRDLLVRRLRRLDIDGAEQAGHGIEALEMLRAHPFDLVLLDVMMPRMNGVQVLEAMKEERRLEETPVVMISAASELDTVVRCIELGAEDYLPKPFNSALLTARVRAALEKKFLRRQNRLQLERLERELAEAWVHQRSMLPSEFAVDPSLIDIHATVDPALEVGGDLYDVFEVAPGLVCIAVGDVAGKGTAAALFMARTRSLLRAGTLQYRAIAARTPSPSEVAALVNEELCKNNPHSKFVTLFLGFYETGSGTLTYCNAGHVYPILAAAGGAAREIDRQPDPALGVLEGLDFADHALTLEIGDLLFLASDGLSDMLNGETEAFGTERILTGLADHSQMGAADAVQRIVGAAQDFASGAPQFDDITVLAMRRLG